MTTAGNCVLPNRTGEACIKNRNRREIRKALEEEIVSPADSQLAMAFEAVGLTYLVKSLDLVKNVCGLQFRRNNYAKFRFCRKLVSSLRFRLSKVCVNI